MSSSPSTSAGAPSPLYRRTLAPLIEDLRHLAVTPATLQDSAPDFATYCQMRTLVVVRAAVLLGIATMVALAPTDFWVYAGSPSLLRVVLATRLSLLVLCVGLYALARIIRPDKSTPLIFAGALFVAGTIFYLAGSSSDPQTPFVYNVIFVPVLGIAFLMPLRMRVLMMTFTCLTALGSYYLPHPANLQYRYIGVIWAYALASIMISAVIGHMLYRLEEGNFDQRRQIRQQVEKLEELNKLKDSFLATVSHELRTPLNAIIGLTDVVLEEKLSPQVQQYMSTIHGSGETLLSIINDILDIAKIKSGKLELESTPFSPYELIESVASLFAPACQKKGLQLSFFASPDLPWIVGDSVRLNQILLNLVGNAVKFTETGEVRLVASWEARQDALPVLTISVFDTGPGIPPAKREQVFDEFTQGDASTTRKYGGTGLGLPIVRRLARLLGGDVSIADNTPRGSVFSLTLPATVAESSSVAKPRLSAATLAATPAAVICTDHPLRAQHLASLLSRKGLAISQSADLEAAANELRRLDETGGGPAVCVIDHSELTPERLQQSSLLALSSTVLRGLVLVLDVQAMTQDGPTYRALGLHALIGRPVQRLQLRQTLQDLLATRSPATPVQALPALQANHRTKLLVVEDVRENQFLIGAFLSKLPVDPVFADNGRQGVERFAQERFDLVLLDIEMPEMDGYEALKHMRAWEKEHGHSATPIIALTAHGSIEHQERTRQAGFTHHLTKPVRKRDFLWLLEQFVYPAEPREGEQPSRPASTSGPSSDSFPAVSPEALLLRSSYLHRRRKELVELQELLQQRNFQKLHRIGHNLKGSGASYGLLDVSAIGQEIEQAAQKGDEMILRDLLEELRRSIEKHV